MFRYSSSVKGNPDFIAIIYDNNGESEEFEFRRDIIAGHYNYVNEHKLETECWSINWVGSNIIFYIQDNDQLPSAAHVRTIRITPEKIDSLLRCLRQWFADATSDIGLLI